MLMWWLAIIKNISKAKAMDENGILKKRQLQKEVFAISTFPSLFSVFKYFTIQTDVNF